MSYGSHEYSWVISTHEQDRVVPTEDRVSTAADPSDFEIFRIRGCHKYPLMNSWVFPKSMSEYLLALLVTAPVF